MADHIHDLPVCGYGTHDPHDPSCVGMGQEVACGTIVDPAHPHYGRALCRHYGRALCRHREGPAAAPGEDGGGNGGSGDTNGGDSPSGGDPSAGAPQPGDTDEPSAGDGGGQPADPGDPSGGHASDGPAPGGGATQDGNGFWGWLKWFWKKLKWLLSEALRWLYTLWSYGLLTVLVLLWRVLASWFPVLFTWPGFVSFLRLLWYTIWGGELPVPTPPTMPDLPPVPRPPNEPPEPPEDAAPEPEPQPEEPEEPEKERPEVPIVAPGPQGGDCEVEIHWWFGRWVRCKGGDRCPDQEHCRLLWRRRGSTERWADAGIVRGGSVKFTTYMEYRCVCRPAPNLHS